MRTLNNNELTAVSGGIGIGIGGRINDGSLEIVIGGGVLPAAGPLPHGGSPLIPVGQGGRIDLGFGGYFFPIFDPAPPLPLPKPEPGKP